jgi:S1-C subfamily serine protease
MRTFRAFGLLLFLALLSNYVLSQTPSFMQTDFEHVQLVQAKAACVTVGTKGKPLIGSGFHIGKGTILTAAHVMNSCSSYSASTGKDMIVTDDSNEVYKVISFSIPDPNQDVAIVRIDPNTTLSYLSFGKMPKVLAKTYIIGTPLGIEYFNNVTVGVVSKINMRRLMWDNAILTTAPAYPGNSGSCLLDKNFKVVGMFVGCRNRDFQGGDNLSLCEPVDDILSSLSKFQKECFWR